MLPRRVFVRRAAQTVLGIAFADVALTACPSEAPASVVEIARLPDDVVSEITKARSPYFSNEGRFYLVPYDTESPKAGTYLSAGVATHGLMAVSEHCTYPGQPCRVSFCTMSQWFECPCCASKWNRAGELKLGPAVRGLDRFKMRVRDGNILVYTHQLVQGPPRGTNTTGQVKEGPFCV